uniref:LrgB-like protein n=1 Tax=Eutreptiella gymnastica TaxID=73025 RepID=A0A7S4CKS8_9EUGL
MADRINMDEVPVAILIIVLIAVLFLVFSCALHLQRRAAAVVSVLGQLLQPVATTTVGTLALVPVIAALRDMPALDVVQEFRGGAGALLGSLLPPAVICMAFGMFKSRALVAKNFVVVMVVTFALAVAGIVILALSARFCGLSSVLAVSLVPTTATTPLAMESTRVLGGGDPNLAATGSILAGVVGALVGRMLLNAMGVSQSILRGLAIGGCSHGIATGMLVMDEPEAAPFSAISFALVGSFTAILLSASAVQQLVLVLLGLYINIPFA